MSCFDEWIGTPRLFILKSYTSLVFLLITSLTQNDQTVHPVRSPSEQALSLLAKCEQLCGNFSVVFA